MSINKKYALSIVAVLLVLSFVSYYVYLDRTIIKEEPLGAFNYAVYENANDLYDDVELVVLATVTSETKDVIIEGEYLDGYSLTKVKIIKELKNEGAPIDKKNSITIIEPAFSLENKFPNLGKTQFYSEDYRKAAPDVNYLLFLNWDEKKEAYWVHALHQGKINVDQKDSKEIAIQEHNEQFKTLKEDVIKTYYNEKE